MSASAAMYQTMLKGQNLFKMLTFLNLTAFMWPQDAMVKDGDSFDFVIVGGGTAGCVIASNLAEQNASVLLVEAGDIPPLESGLAGLFPFTKNTDYDWNFTSTRNETTMQSHIGERTQMHRGKVLGGTAQVNFMLYGIGQPRDYDEWATLTNDTCWSYDHLFPLIKKTERVTNKEILNSPDVKYHGTKGKQKIKKYYSTKNDGLFEAYTEMGYKVLNDINPETPIGFSNAYFTIGNLIRYSTAYGFLRHQKDNPSLKVMYNSLVTKIIINNNKCATGVQILTKDEKLISIKAKKEVIVTAGPIKSPQLLMLSGIGPKEHLESKGIKVISDLRVGQNLQDNPTTVMLYKLEKAKSIAPLNPNEFSVMVMEGQIAVNKSQKYADYQILSGIIADPKYFVVICGFVFSYKNELCDKYYSMLANRQVHYVTHNLLYSASRGTILLNSTNPEDQPIINPCYYCNSSDLERHAKYLEHYNSIVNTTYFKMIGAEFVDPGLESCNGKEKGTNDFWKSYALGMATTLHNYAGTCAMGCVLDSKLRVKGVTHLRVADASVIPKLVGNTVQATTIIIAQKISAMLIKEYKLCAK